MGLATGAELPFKHRTGVEVQGQSPLVQNGKQALNFGTATHIKVIGARPHKYAAQQRTIAEAHIQIPTGAQNTLHTLVNRQIIRTESKELCP